MWKLMLHTLIAFSFISENLSTPAIRPQSMRGIIFPTVDQYEECYVDEAQTIKGTCKNLGECRSAVQRWKNENIRPQTCYFNKFEQVVCCEKEDASTREPPTVYRPPISGDVKRRSEAACESFNVFRVTIILGVPTKPNEFPYMAALGWKSNFDDSIHYRCGGVLISNKFVLTAAHCAELGGASPTTVRLGGVNLTDASSENIPIKRIIIHPSYNVRSSYNDIALLELSKEANAKPACVWSEQNVDHHTNVTAIGYGHTRFGGLPSNQLLKASLFVVNNDRCKQFYAPDAQLLQRGLSNTQICAGDPERKRDTCQGDSGGPLIMSVERDSTISYVVGITSFGEGCAGEPPSIYTRTSSYIDWIENIVWPIPKGTNN